VKLKFRVSTWGKEKQRVILQVIFNGTFSTYQFADTATDRNRKWYFETEKPVRVCSTFSKHHESPQQQVTLPVHIYV